MAFGTGAFALDFILNNGYTVDEVDAITGPLIGRPKTATFRLIDLVGVDVWDHVGKNLAPLIPYDKLAQKYLKSEAQNKLIETLIGRNWLGNKTKIGFYKEVRREDGGKEFWPLDLKKAEHVPPTKPRFDSVAKAKDIPELGERLKLLLEETDRAAQLVQALVYQGCQYAASLLPEIADSPKPIDDAVRWGFGYEAGPFEMWDMLGVKETVKQNEGFRLSTGKMGRDHVEVGDRRLSINIRMDPKLEYTTSIKGNMCESAEGGAVIVLKEKKVIKENAGATFLTSATALPVWISTPK